MYVLGIILGYLIVLNGQDIISDCLDKEELLFFDIGEIFVDAEIRCSNVGGEVLSINTRNKQNKVLQFYQDENIIQSCWLNMFRSNNDSLNPLSFEFKDESLLEEDFANLREVDPWDIDEPNDEQGNETCVALRIERLLWHDQKCTLDFIRTICQRTCETPTLSPTKQPTLSPTLKPTLFPSISPTFLTQISSTPTRTTTTNIIETIVETSIYLVFICFVGSLFVFLLAVYFMKLGTLKKIIISQEENVFA